MIRFILSHYTFTSWAVSSPLGRMTMSVKYCNAKWPSPSQRKRAIGKEIEDEHLCHSCNELLEFDVNSGIYGVHNFSTEG
ncbi:hypothetical protein CRYUN_Cryun08bG0009600 [Craigia yunnanensis]